MLRTGELMAIHRYDGVEQYFGRAYEFGFSFSVEETFAKWGREETLGDVVRVVRAFRPDVILTLPLEGEGGGQHHQAAGRLAREAFRAAADPARFPEQLREGLRPWQARKIYQGGVGGYGEVPGTPVRVPTGVYDPVLGMTWQQLGQSARGRCTAARGRDSSGPTPGRRKGCSACSTRSRRSPRPRATSSTASTRRSRRSPPATPLLAPELAALQGKARRRPGGLRPRRAREGRARARRGPRAVRALAQGLDARVADAAGARRDRRAPAEEEADVEAALALAQGLVLEARADDGLVTPGEEVGVAVSLFNDGGTGLDVEALELEAPPGWTVGASRGRGRARCPAGGARRARFAVVVAPDARPSQPYWRREKDRDRNELLVPADETRPWSPPVLVARARCRVNGVVTTLRAPVAWRYEGPFVGGETPARGAGRARAVGARLAGDRRGAARRAPPAGRGARLRAPPRARRGHGRRPPRGAAGLVGRPAVVAPALLLRGRGGGRPLHRHAARPSSTPAALRPAGGGPARRPRVPRGGAGRRVRPRRAPAAPAPGARRASSSSTCGRPLASRSATSWARATRSPTPSGRWAFR